MPKQKVPDIDFDYFVLSEIVTLIKDKKICINENYQRGDIWKHNQRIELIQSIENRYSIGIIVLFINEAGQYEILDGQQRLLAIEKYLNNTLDLEGSELKKCGDLSQKEKALLDAYCVYYLKLKSHDPETKEEDIVQTFLRLQEGTPLNKAEKINAYRGKFKETFRRVRDTHPLFNFLGPEKRFRWRQLSAEMLLIELEGDFKNKIFQNIDLPALKNALKKYQQTISDKTVRFFVGNLDFLHQSLNLLLTAFGPREIISFYLLVSYLRKIKADNSNLMGELFEFAGEFLKNLNSFSIYDNKPPKGMSKEIFDRYMQYKQESKKLTTSESIKNRLEIMLIEFQRIKPFIEKDPKRLHDAEQKRILFFKQKGLCDICKKSMDFRADISSHHVDAHSAGGSTDDLSKAVLLHKKCHERLEKQIQKSKK